MAEGFRQVSGSLAGGSANMHFGQLVAENENMHFTL